MLVNEETANDLHREVSRIEKSRHFVYVISNGAVTWAFFL